MKTGKNHLLQKVIFDINLTRQDGAFEIQNRISNAFRSGVMHKLEQLFDANVEAGRVISIDKLEIDLGNITSEKIEEDLESHLVKAMSDFLAYLTVEMSNQATDTGVKTYSSRNINIRWSVPGKPLFETEVKVSDDFTSHFDRVIHYLQTGVLSPGFRGTRSDRLSDLINPVLETHADQFTKFLQNRGTGYQVFHRLVLNLSSAQLMYVAALLGCGFSGSLSDRVIELARYFKEEGVDTRTIMYSRAIYFAQPEHYIWWMILVKYAGSELMDYERISRHKGGESRISSGSQAEAQLLAEILLITRQLSERSDFPGSGIQNVKRGYNYSNVLVNAVKLVQKLVEGGSAESEIKEESSITPHKPGAAIFVDPVSLIKNSLFTLPEKKPGIVSVDQRANIPDLDDSLYIDNAGLIILGPFLKTFFSRMGLLKGNEFISAEAQWKAAHLLQEACGFERNESDEVTREGWSENSLLFNKILCGIEVHQALPEHIELSEKEKNETQELLNSVLHHWTILRSSSVRALQSTFLQKQGRLSINGGNWDLIIERDSAVEILIDKLPWTISLVKLPWNGYSIQTQW